MSAEPPVSQVRATVAAALRQYAGGTGALERVCRTCVELLPVDGASISVTSGPAHREVLYASDEVISRIDALQFSLCEGPCFEASGSHRPVLVPDLAEASASRWPAFAAESAGLPVGAIFAFPLHSGAISIGAIDMYRRRPGWLSTAELAIALEVVDVAVVALLNLRLGAVDGERWVILPRDRAEVHQATGMLIAALDIPAEQALDRLRAHAFSTGRLVDQVAHDVVTRRLSPFDIGP